MFDAQSHPAPQPSTPPLVGESEYTQMMRASTPPPAPAPSAAAPASAPEEPKKKSLNIYLILALVFVILLAVGLGVAWLIAEFSTPVQEAGQPGGEPSSSSSSTSVPGSSRVRGPSVRGPTVQTPTSLRAPTVRGPEIRKPTVSGSQVTTGSLRGSTSQSGETPASQGGQRRYLFIIIGLGVLLVVAIGVVVYMLLKR
ncbi:MAG: hypothetical protein GY953_37270 [bacterium]|nr:hypothetical protein [bacterium]